MNSTRAIVRLAAVSLVTVVAASAQKSVWPAGFANTFGDTAQATPFSVSGGLPEHATRSVFYLSGATLPTPIVQGAPIRGIAFRRDNVDQVTSYPGRFAQVEIRMGPISSSAVPNRALNHPYTSKAALTVFTRKLVSLPSAPPAASLAFPLQFPLDRSYPYAGGDLAIEILAESTAGVWRCDAVSRPADPGRVVQLGGGCPSPAGYTPLGWVDSWEAVVGGNLNCAVEMIPEAPQGQGSMLMIGLSRRPPLPLGQLGFDPQCQLLLHPMLSQLVRSGNNQRLWTTAQQSFAIPSTGSLAGLSLALQWFPLLQYSTSAVPLIASNGIEVTIGTPSTASTVWGRSQWTWGAQVLGRSNGGTLGELNYVPVIEFTY